MKALPQARIEGRVRYLGLTGHHDPAILLTAMQEFDFNTVLIPLNAADILRLSFRDTVLLEAARRNMGIIGMKSTTQGILLKNGTVTMAEGMRMPEMGYPLGWRDHYMLWSCG
ncbi:MAG: hypothetical protein WCJ35_22685, partial [Planctomycetota bacterium]